MNLYNALSKKQTIFKVHFVFLVLDGHDCLSGSEQLEHSTKRLLLSCTEARNTHRFGWT